MPTDTEIRICAVCDLQVEPYMVAECGQCGRIYHLNSRADLPGEDCGQVWINEDHLGLEFACNTCLNPQPATSEGQLDDILDLAEAAAVSGLEESVLARYAQLGHVKHRKTGSGVLLFVRADVIAFASSH